MPEVNPLLRINHPDERQEIVDAAYNFLMREITMAQSVDRILSMIRHRIRHDASALSG